MTDSIEAVDSGDSEKEIDFEERFEAVTEAIFGKEIEPVKIFFPVLASVIHKRKSLGRHLYVMQYDDGEGNEGESLRCLIHQNSESGWSCYGSESQASCIDLEDPKRLVYSYTRMSFAGLLFTPEPESILVVGLGGGSVPMTFGDLFPGALIDVVEIDPAVVDLARRFFLFEESENMRVHVEDGRGFIKRAELEGQRYDYIMLDAFMGDNIPQHLAAEEFLQETKQILNPGGVMVANIIASSRQHDRMVRNYRRVWKRFYNLRQGGNHIVLACNEALPSRANLADTAQRLARRLEKYGIHVLAYPEHMMTDSEWLEEFG